MTPGQLQDAARRSRVASAAQLACALEASAPKPGNVSPGRPFADLTYEDFLASAAAIGPVLADAERVGLGRLVRQAVEATSVWVSTNANIGIVLLLVPMTKAAIGAQPGDWTGLSGPRVPLGLNAEALWSGLERVLTASTIEDARQVYAAIRLARPSGLGAGVEQDVADEPSITLLEAMRLASERDGVAREYASAYRTTRAIGVPALTRARRAGLSWNDAIVEAFLALLSTQPDTHIARRVGWAAAEAVSRDAASVVDAGGVRTEVGRRLLGDFDRSLRSPDHARNPGTTADLTAAAIFAVLLTSGWGGPRMHE